ncbi:MAG: UTP--glucose-1-phosphate uridylyltransferase [Bacteroidia bacterium]|jgi:UTP--glucose-1-phosphate uridylyltransferase
MKVRKAVIPAAGFGTRMLPISSVVPKELLPVCGRPVIEFVVREAVEAGIEEIILVLSEGKEAVADYFKPNKKLTKHLLQHGNHAELAVLERIWDLAKITVVYQNEQKGLGHAVLCAKEAVGNEPFAVLLGDCIIETEDCDSFTKQLTKSFHDYGASVVGLEEVEKNEVSRYGIFEGHTITGNILNAQRLIEKPAVNETDSTLAFCARYVFQPDIFPLLEQTKKGTNNEIQLTDAMQKLVETKGMNGFKLEGTRYDIGNPKGLLYANLSLTNCGDK